MNENLMSDTQQDIKKVTIRTASTFGFQLANDVARQLESEQVFPNQWPAKFPLTIKHIAKIPEIAGNQKVARRVSEAAKLIWQDIRSQAVEVQKDMELHPEFYQEQLVEDAQFDQDRHMREHCWRHLAFDCEQIAGFLYVTEFQNDDEAQAYVNHFISSPSLKTFMDEFEDDYFNFMGEIREAMRRRTELDPAARFDLICSLNANTQAATRLMVARKRRKKTKTHARNAHKGS